MNYEVIITSDGNYMLLHMGKERVVNVEQCLLPTITHELNLLTLPGFKLGRKSRLE
jgi:hypothetical protein